MSFIRQNRTLSMSLDFADEKKMMFNKYLSIHNLLLLKYICVQRINNFNPLLMKPKRVLTAIFLSIFLSGLFFSCEWEEETSYEYFHIKVDSIQLAEDPIAGTPFEIRFYGTIGTNGCYQFEEFREKQTNSDIIIEAIGRYNKSAEICTSVMVFLDEKILNLTIEESGQYTIKIKQPDGNYMEREILVKENE